MAFAFARNAEPVREEPGDPEADEKRDHHAGETGADGDLSLPQHQRQLHFQARHEEQHHDAEREDAVERDGHAGTFFKRKKPVEKFRRQLPEHRRAERDADEQLTHDHRQLPSFSQLGDHARRDEHDADGEQENDEVVMTELGHSYVRE